MAINVAELSTGDLVEFARWLLDAGLIAPGDTDELLYFFEKPYKWDKEYDEYTRMKGNNVDA